MEAQEELAASTLIYGLQPFPALTATYPFSVQASAAAPVYSYGERPAIKEELTVRTRMTAEHFDDTAASGNGFFDKLSRYDSLHHAALVVEKSHARGRAGENITYSLQRASMI